MVREDGGRMIRSSVLNILPVRCLLDIQVENINRKLDVWIWSSRDSSGLELYIWESLAYRWYLKPETG